MMGSRFLEQTHMLWYTASAIECDAVVVDAGCN